MTAISIKRPFLTLNLPYLNMFYPLTAALYRKRTLTLKLCGANEAQRSLRPNKGLVMARLHKIPNIWGQQSKYHLIEAAQSMNFTLNLNIFYFCLCISSKCD